MTTFIGEGLHLEFAGENSLLLYFSVTSNEECVSSKHSSNKQVSHYELMGVNVISPSINSRVEQACILIRQYLNDVIIDLIPSYASILVVFNLSVTDHHFIRTRLAEILAGQLDCKAKKTAAIHLPVYYSVDYGLDLPRIAKHSNLTVEQVITLHQAQEYRVYAIGFAPGFAYLGEVDNLIAMPRLASPRAKVPQGAVAIADRQTAVYPAESPGGWNIIGLCPTDMFQPNRKPTMPFNVGDTVRFHAIDKQEYLSLGGVLPDH